MSFGKFKRGIRKFGKKYSKAAVIGLRKIKNTTERIAGPAQKVGRVLELAGAATGFAPLAAFGGALESTARGVNIAAHVASGVATGIQKLNNRK